jgi:site-specific DNA-methyltransferase (adenine-specific)
MTSKRRAGARPVLRPNILRYGRPTGADRRHNAAKPVPLMAELIENSSDEGAWVVDLFGGGGSTLLGAERCGRRCAIMEMEPSFADVIVERWEAATGSKAKR